MDRFRLRTATLIVAAALIGLGAGLALGLFGSDDEAGPHVDSPSSAEEGTAAEPEARREAGPAPSSEPDLPPVEEDPQGLEPGPSGPAPSSGDETAAARAARTYVEAISARDGRKVCDAFAPGGLEGIRLPERRASCPASVNASLGFQGAQGQPVWRRSEMTRDVSAQVSDDSARVVATVFTEYADVREPTIEDDIIYLSRSGERWLVVQPSATLYRAVGIADVPLEALEPPG